MGRNDMRIFGKVKTIIRDKGFGFIREENTGQEWFFHRSGMADRMEFDRLNETDPVTFEPGTSPKGPRASDVRPA